MISWAVTIRPLILGKHHVTCECYQGKGRLDLALFLVCSGLKRQNSNKKGDPTSNINVNKKFQKTWWLKETNMEKKILSLNIYQRHKMNVTSFQDWDTITDKINILKICICDIPRITWSAHSFMYFLSFIGQWIAKSVTWSHQRHGFPMSLAYFVEASLP